MFSQQEALYRLFVLLTGMLLTLDRGPGARSTFTWKKLIPWLARHVSQYE